MASQENTEESSVTSRISMFNKHVEQHREWQRVNPFSHCSVRDVPKRTFLKDQYGTPPPGTLTEQRALQAQVLSLRENLQLCGLISEKGEQLSGKETTEMGLTFGELFELYNHISDKLVGTLLCARRHKYIDFEGETLFQGRDDAVLVRLLRPFQDIRDEIINKIEELRCTSVEKPVEPPEPPELCEAHFL